MKVNEVITEAGVWQGIKNVGRGIGQIAGGAATGTIGLLDRMAGGSGDVGTRAQRAQRKTDALKNNLAEIDKELPKQALAYFQTQLADQGMNLSDPTSFNPTAVRNEMRAFAFNFFAGGEEQEIKSYIAQTLPFEPLPNKINSQTALNYFKEITKIRSNAAIWVAQNQENLAAAEKNQTREPATQEPPARPVSAGGVTLASVAGRDNAGQLTPTRVIYNNKPYALQDDGSWVDILKNKTVNPALASFLQQELESIS
jgi:hypothetical protein